LRKRCAQYAIIPNFCLNLRNGQASEREEYFDEILYSQRRVIEHSFAWLNA